MATDYRATVEQVHRAFCDETYWLARLADSGADEVRLDSFEVGHDGGIDVVTTAATWRSGGPRPGRV